jgi:hypothetical protein
MTWKKPAADFARTELKILDIEPPIGAGSDMAVFAAYSAAIGSIHVTVEAKLRQSASMMSERKLAVLCGTSRTTVWRWLRMTVPARAALLVDLRNRLGCEPKKVVFPRL